MEEMLNEIKENISFILFIQLVDCMRDFEVNVSNVTLVVTSFAVKKKRKYSN